MTVVELVGHEHDAAVLALLAAAQVHRSPLDARNRAPAIADEYAFSGRLSLSGYRQGTRVVGIVGVEIDGGVGIVRDLAVAPDVRRRGIGRVLVRHLQGRVGVSLWWGHTLAAAAAFYEGCGFVVDPDGEMPTGETRYRFTWRLSGPPRP